MEVNSHIDQLDQLDRQLKQAQSLLGLFQTGCRLLRDLLPLTRASLSHYDVVEEVFRIRMLMKCREFLSGIEFRLEPESSLLGEVRMNGNMIIESRPFPRDLPFMDTKLLLGDETHTLAIIPLLADRQLLGTFNLGLSELPPYVSLEGILQPFSEVFSHYMTAHLSSSDRLMYLQMSQCRDESVGFTK